MGPSARSPRGLAGALAAGAAALVALWLAAGGTATLRTWVESPETGIRRALAAAPVAGPRPLPSTAARVRIDRAKYADLVVGAGSGGAEVVAVADADGAVAWRGLDVSLSYVGRERLSMARCPGAGWCVQGEPLPRLAAVLSTLARRADALEDADADRYRPLVADGYRDALGGRAELLDRLAADLGARPRARFRPLAWQVRIERETAQVGEDYEVTVGDRPARRLRARLELRDEGGRWRITGGL